MSEKCLKVSIPEDLSDNLEQFCQRPGARTRKAQIVALALRQFLTIREEEESFKQVHPGHNVQSRLVFEAFPTDNSHHEMASVLTY